MPRGMRVLVPSVALDKWRIQLVGNDLGAALSPECPNTANVINVVVGGHNKFDVCDSVSNVSQ